VLAVAAPVVVPVDEPVGVAVPVLDVVVDALPPPPKLVVL